MITEKYLRLEINGENAYIRKNGLMHIAEIDAIVFDCDGVLIDIKDSYNKVISKTVAYVIKKLTSCDLQQTLISDEITFLFRSRGGFNNDWDIVYGILMFLLCSLPEGSRSNLSQAMGRNMSQPDPFVRLSRANKEVREDSERTGLDEGFFKGLLDRLKQFTRLLDASGVDSINENLLETYGSEDSFLNFFEVLRRFLYDPPVVGKSIVATLFEEYFGGSKLFHETWKLQPRFYRGSGMIKNEKCIISDKTLNLLTSILGKSNLGIASGSKLKPAEYVLKDRLDHFNPRALIFADRVEKAEREQLDKGIKTSLRKPNPFSLLESVKALKPAKCPLYVGDSMEDIMTVEEAKSTHPNFLFAGVYRFSSVDDALLDSLLKYGCDIVVPSVNELPFALEAAGGKQK